MVEDDVHDDNGSKTRNRRGLVLACLAAPIPVTAQETGAAGGGQAGTGGAGTGNGTAGAVPGQPGATAGGAPGGTAGMGTAGANGAGVGGNGWALPERATAQLLADRISATPKRPTLAVVAAPAKPVGLASSASRALRLARSRQLEHSTERHRSNLRDHRRTTPVESAVLKQNGGRALLASTALVFATSRD